MAIFVWSWQYLFGHGSICLVMAIFVWSWQYLFGHGNICLVMAIFVWSWQYLFGHGNIDTDFSNERFIWLCFCPRIIVETEETDFSTWFHFAIIIIIMIISKVQIFKMPSVLYKEHDGRWESWLICIHLYKNK